MIDIIFVHGWGMDSKIWNAMRADFPDACYVDLGFTGNKEQFCTGRAIYVTHSLGTVWALKHHAQDMAGLVAINGFSAFTRFADTRVLHGMKKHLHRTPERQMTEFWNNCGLADGYNAEKLNQERLQDGLNWLIDWDMTDVLHGLSSPILSLGGELDAILPQTQMQAEWSGFDLRIQADGNHVLPLSHPHWCTKQIKDFIHAL